MNYLDDETPRHKKKSQAKPPKKASHKHIFEPCIIEYPADWYVKSHLQSGKKRAEFYGFCPICGKVGETDRSKWYTKELGRVGTYPYFNTVPTEEGSRELNPETRTLPSFICDDPFAKFVNLGDNL